MDKNHTALENIISFAREMISTPSRAGEDSPKKIVDVIVKWADNHGLSFNHLEDNNGQPLGGYFHYSSGKPGPSVCLDACIDTCSFGTEEAWKESPTSAKIEDGYLHGRGAADSKIAASIFCHIFEEVARKGLEKGELYVLLDADEHTGNFGGVKKFLDKNKKIDVTFIGYPGNKEIMVGARGFLRATVSVLGQAAHSGSRTPAKDNAVLKAARLIDMISSTALPAENDPDFEFGPKVTITAINGGTGFSQVPDKVDISVDMRLTPAFDKKVADRWLRNITENFDQLNSSSPTTVINFHESWPSYALSQSTPAVATLRQQAEKAFKRPVKLSVCGPSNIGNLLAAHNIPAICGFGVDYTDIHAPNEKSRISTIKPVFKTYYNTVKLLCS